MAASMKLFSTLCLLLMLIFATETMVTEARECERQSPSYYGTCFANNANMNSNCNSICECDGFDRGFCRLTKCYCRVKC
ncbi:defensin J1-2-like isoform X2 [Capsicum annuum]|uniref:defensin J1-2-like isoform X1 n=1 Tax=Capsicum annuum TaxID=4072 RepID=UPI001FB07448|nr:defensin J1-2-like isoform X1 [Capsicum annuum]XP_047265630.1 defensin J1-2-like isoform X2 [Capsicum annuum]